MSKVLNLQIMEMRKFCKNKDHLNCLRFENKLSLFALIFFCFLAIINSVFVISSFEQFLFKSIIYIVLILGIVISLHYSKLLGRENFAGKGLFFITISFVTSLLSNIILDHGIIFDASYNYTALVNIFWSLSLLTLLGGIYSMLMPVHLDITRAKIIETISLFLIFSLGLFLIFGFPNQDQSLVSQFFYVLFTFLDALFMSTSILILKTSKGSSRKGLILFVIGILLLILVKEISILTESINFFRLDSFMDFVPVLLTLLSWSFIVVGVSSIGKSFIRTKHSY